MADVALVAVIVVAETTRPPREHTWQPWMQMIKKKEIAGWYCLSICWLPLVVLPVGFLLEYNYFIGGMLFFDGGSPPACCRSGSLSRLTRRTSQVVVEEQKVSKVLYTSVR